MALNYAENKGWDTILPVLEEHAVWFHGLVQNLFYPEISEQLDSISRPSSFAYWIVYANREGDVSPEIIEKLTTLHADLFKVADVLLYASKETRQKPHYKDFKTFLTVYEEFTIHMRRLEKDALIEGSGYDSFTGLRSAKVFIPDLEREMDRLSRQGRDFCVALCCIDQFDLIEKHLSKDEAQACIKLVADLIKLSIRSYDDGYHIRGNEFVLSLKQSDVTGGIAALERLKDQLEHQKITLNVEGENALPLSMSCCIVAPSDGDDVNVLLDDLRRDLRRGDRVDTESVLEYREVSPLLKYVQDGE